MVRRAAAVAAVVLYAWWASALRPFSWAALVAVVGAGVAAVALGARRRDAPGSATPPPSLGVAGALGWVALWGALAAWELAAYVQHPRGDHPTLSSLADDVLGSHPARALAFLAWLALGAALARR